MKGVQVEGKHNGNSERFHNQLVCCCSVTKLCPALCNPMDCSIPGFPVLHYLPEIAQTHVHGVDDTIQTSHPLFPPSPPAFIFPSIRIFSNDVYVWVLFCLPETIITLLTGHQIRSDQSLSCVLFSTYPWTAAFQASLSFTISQSLLKLMSVELVMPSNHLILCHPLLFLPSIFASIRIFSNESVLHIRWPKNWSFSFNISPSNEYSGLISFRIDWLDLLAV